MKWALARLVNNQGARGFVSWDAYREFKTAEKSEPSLHVVSGESSLDPD